MPPRRGWLVDRNGKPIANNKTDFRVDIIPDRLRDRKKTVATLADLLALDSEELERINRELEQASSFQPVQVATGLDWPIFPEFHRVRASRATIPAVRLSGIWSAMSA